MPINLLAEKSTEKPVKGKPVNLLPEITGVYEDSNGSVDVPEVSPQKPFIEDVGNAFMSGLNRTWANAARVPAGIYDLAAMPQNFLVKALGRADLQVQSPEWLMDNPIAELYDYQTQSYRNEVTPTKSFEEALATKDFDGISRHIAIQVVENAPQQIGMILSYMAGYPGAGLTGMGLLAGTDALKEGRKNKKDPAMSAYNALTHGVVEAGFESIGTMGILKTWSKALTKSFGTKNAVRIIGDIFKTIFYSMAGEGNEELWTSLAQDFSSFATGVNADAMKGSLVRAFEAGTIGAVSGGLLTGPGAIKLGHRSASLEKMQKEVQGVTETLIKEEKEAEAVEAGIPPEEAVPGAPEGVVEAIEPVEGVEVAPIKAELIKTTPITKESVKRALDVRLEKEIRELEKKEERRLSLIEKAKLEVKSIEATLQAVRETPEFTEMGENIFEGKQELIRDLIADRKFQQEKISRLRPEKVARTTTAILKEKIRNIQRGIREGKTIAKEEIKTVQDSVIKLFKEADLEIPVGIKNIQTQEQLTKALPEMEKRIARLQESAIKRATIKGIKQQLKTTKPLKVGQRRVGKFDYETNELFDTLRDYNNLSQAKAQAELDKMPDEPTSELDLIKTRFLSLKANGASASAEIHTQVLNDILRIKRLGLQAKDEADLIKALNRQERVESALDSIDKITGNKDTIIGKIVNVYRTGFSDIYSMLNSLGGKDFAETYDPILSESDRNAAVYKKTLDVTVEASKIYNDRNVMRLFETMSTKDYEITDAKDGLTTQLTKLDLIDIYNSLKNEKKRTDYYEAFGKEQVQDLMGSLTSKDTAFGDALQEAVQEYREVLNQRSIETTGRDLGFVENYWPATSEFQVNVLDDIRVQGETPSAAKERAKGSPIPIPKNAWYKAQRHIAQAEHVANISREFETLKRLFNDRKVKHAIKEKYGEDVYNTLIAQIDNISLNKQTERIDAISRTFQRAINNWVTAKIALNPSTYVRQLMSMGNYAENMNPGEWVKGFFEGITSPRKTFEFMWKNDPSLEARFNKGFNEALKEAIEGAERISVNRKNYTKFLTALVRSGDITAIIYGGFPLVKAELAKGKADRLSDAEAMKKAIGIFRNATLKSQQSGLSSGISQFQNSRNPFTRLFLAFKNTSNQYFRKMVNATISYQNGDITLEQFAKTMTIYAIIQPIAYVAAGHATSAAFGLLGSLAGLRQPDEPEELAEKFLNAVMIQLIVSPANAIPIIDDVVRTAARMLTGQKVYKIFSTPLFDDLETGLRALTKKEITGDDYLKTTASILEPIIALPIKTGIRLFKIFTGKKSTGKKLIR